MSIYATGPMFKIEMWPPGHTICGPGQTISHYEAEIVVQFVPGHIGHPHSYPEGDPYGDFLPPVVDDEDDIRAAVIVLRPFNHKDGQRYTEPLLVLSREEWHKASFGELMGRISTLARVKLLAAGILQKHQWVVPVKS